nr:carcinoembryonic antigen-related cell adhesion molecule 19 [Pogona vitticeps]
MKDPTLPDLFWKSFLFAVVLLCLWIPPAAGTMGRLSVVSIPEIPMEGQNVTLSAENVTGTIREISWFRGPTTDGASRLFSYFPGNSRPQRNGNQNTQREFGFPNGSLLITGVQPRDAKQYIVLILLRPKGILRGALELQVAGSATTPRPTTPTTQMPSVKEQPRAPLMLGWIVAGVVVGILLAGALGAILVYRFVLYKTEPGPGVTGKLDPRGKKTLAPKHGDKEPIYEVMDSPVESPQTGGKEPPPILGPLPTLPGPGANLDPNYMELLRRTESIYSEIKR